MFGSKHDRDQILKRPSLMSDLEKTTLGKQSATQYSLKSRQNWTIEDWDIFVAEKQNHNQFTYGNRNESRPKFGSIYDYAEAAGRRAYLQGKSNKCPTELFYADDTAGGGFVSENFENGFINAMADDIRSRKK